LRIVRIQIPIDVTRIVNAGRSEWRTTSSANVQFQPTVVV
jgi:hypothetical protein